VGKACSFPEEDGATYYALEGKFHSNNRHAPVVQTGRRASNRGWCLIQQGSPPHAHRLSSSYVMGTGMGWGGAVKAAAPTKYPID
jgi:hypothetical protein